MTVLARTPTTTFASPGDLTAPDPPETRGARRDQIRLLAATADGIDHLTFAGIGSHLRAGDVLVVNTSATMPGQLVGHSRSHGELLVHVANRLSDGTRVVELRSHPNAADPLLDGRSGEVIDLPGSARLELLEPYPASDSSPTGQGNRLWRGALRVEQKVHDYLVEHAAPISYGYLSRTFDLSYYQTVFGLRPGSAEMPSGGRGFTPELVTALIAQGVLFAPITLHTGVSSQEAGEAPQSEWFEVTASSAALVNHAHASGGRVVAVGTTATRALESATDPDGVVRAAGGWTDLVISPDRPVRVVDGLVTGWHDPEASHLLLVESVAGAELTQRAYDAAVAEQYRWHEFGDAGLLLP